MIQYTPPTPRRRWPGVILIAVVLVAFLLLISACSGSTDTLSECPRNSALTVELLKTQRCFHNDTLSVESVRGHSAVRTKRSVLKDDEYTEELLSTI